MGIRRSRQPKTDWNTLQGKYSNASELYQEHYPSEETMAMGKEYPHEKDDITKGVAIMVWLYISELLRPIRK